MTCLRFNDAINHFDAVLGDSYSRERRVLLTAICQSKAALSDTHLTFREKGNNEIVTECDLLIENALKDSIRQQFPLHSFWGEEAGISGEHAYQWIIDPIDGTLNFARGLPHFAISVALACDGKIVMGAIYLPGTDELFFAQTGAGSWIWEHRIGVSGIEELAQCIIDVGIYHGLESASQAVDATQRLLRFVRSFRSLGSTCVGLAYTACGRVDGFFHTASWPWDWAAGVLLVKEAGGLVTNEQDQELRIINASQFIIASNAHIHHQLCEIIANKYSNK